LAFPDTVLDIYTAGDNKIYSEVQDNFEGGPASQFFTTQVKAKPGFTKRHNSTQVVSYISYEYVLAIIVHVEMKVLTCTPPIPRCHEPREHIEFDWLQPSVEPMTDIKLRRRQDDNDGLGDHSGWSAGGDWDYVPGGHTTKI
jgi:hypothetical protein